MAFNIDPVHLGIIFMANCELGFLTLPMGENVFVASLRFNQPVLKLFVYVLPFWFIMAGCLAVITYWPALSLWLLDFLGQRPALIQM